MARLAEELPIRFECRGHGLIGVLHLPPGATAAVVVVVGGPQYRVGSHRQFLLMARALAEAGFAVLRFDCRGMGDSEGEFPGFEYIEPDIAAAVEALIERAPTVTSVVLWGLCDATLALSAHAAHDRRIAAVVLLNPWVRTQSSHARAQLKHYYLGRLLQGELLRKILRGEFNPLASARDLLRHLGSALRPVRTGLDSSGERVASNPLAEAMARSLLRFPGRILLIVSGRDLTAREFEGAAAGSELWQQLFRNERFHRETLAEADHTFSRRSWRDQVTGWTRASLALETPAASGRRASSGGRGSA